jgi:hypothetical protein
VSYVAVFLVGLLAAMLPGTWQRSRIVEGTVAHYGVWSGLRPGLREHLAVAGARLREVEQAVRGLESGSSKKADRGDRAAWSRLRADLDELALLLRQIEDVYCLEPEEKAVVAEEVVRKVAELRQALPPAVPSAPPNRAAEPPQSTADQERASRPTAESPETEPKDE